MTKELHIICGKCGCNDSLTFKIDPRGHCDGSGKEYPSVGISCSNCGNLSTLDETMPQEGGPV